MIVRTLKGLFVAAAVAATLAGCTTGQLRRGYVFDEDLANAIAPGVDNRDSVLATLGTPTMADRITDKTWYYSSTLVKIRPIFWPKATDHRVLAITFADNGSVASVQNFGLDDMRDIRPVNDETPTKGRELSIFQQLFQSVGQFGGQPQGNPNAPTGPNG